MYAFYVQAKDAPVVIGFNLLWLTILPATFGLLRCILVLEHGLFDDPTELAYRDRRSRPRDCCSSSSRSLWY